MKTILLSLTLFFAFFSFAQNRKEILKEINSYKKITYENETLTTDTSGLKILIQDFFKHKKYHFVYEQQNTLTFVKNVPIMHKTQNYDREVYHYRAGRYEEMAAKYFVNVVLQSSNGKTKQPHVYANQEIFRNRTTVSETLGKHRFNELEFYSYLHEETSGTSLEMPKKLKAKIENYNTQQTKEKKKLIAGRDY